ncbi:MAG: ABC-F family ATP-binding cassette domain-containing protein [Bacteroidota bacterium]
MLTATNIYVQYGDRVLLDKVNLVIKDRDKVGLVGRNGAGKSTLLKILAREKSPHEGNVSQPSGATLAFLHQDIEIDQNRTVIDETMLAFEALKQLNLEIDSLNAEIATRTDYESEDYLKVLERFSELNERYAILGGDSAEGDASRVLQGLGFKTGDFQRPLAEFSGGWQMRVILAKMLLQKPNYLLLDEPTNHLDIESIIWLERFLKDYPGAVIIISHDQQFLDNCTKRTIEIELGRVQDYNAAYSGFLELRKDRREKMLSAYENQQKVIAQRERTINRFMAKATKTKMAQSMKKQLDKMERIEVESEDVAAMNIRFAKPPRSGQIVLEAKDLDKSYGDLQVLNQINLTVERNDRVAFVGQNGQGKTTLAKILIGAIEHSDGHVQQGHNVAVGYYAQNQAESLGRDRTLLETMEDHSPPEMRTRLRNILGAFMFSGEDADKKVSVLSGGERARLALACLLLKPFNLLVLDEPTNHLDIISKEVLKQALLEYEGTLIVVSHDRQFLEDLTDRTIEFRDGKLHDHLGDVNYFLSKREMDNMREVETQRSKKPKSKKGGTPHQPNPASEKALRKASNIERKIESLEAKMTELESTMGQDGFYDSDKSQDILDTYNKTKEEISNLYDRWESLQLSIETNA